MHNLKDFSWNWSGHWSNIVLYYNIVADNLFGIVILAFEFGIERIPNCLCRTLAFWHTLALAIGRYLFVFRTPALYSNLENDYFAFFLAALLCANVNCCLRLVIAVTVECDSLDVATFIVIEYRHSRAQWWCMSVIFFTFMPMTRIFMVTLWHCYLGNFFSHKFTFCF